MYVYAQIHTYIHTQPSESVFVVCATHKQYYFLHSSWSHFSTFPHVLAWATVTEYSRQVVLNNIYFHTRLWKTWHVMKAQFLLHALPSWLSPRIQSAGVHKSHPRDPDHLPEALCPDSFRLGIKFEHVSFGGAHWWLACIVTEGTVQTAGEKGH